MGQTTEEKWRFILVSGDHLLVHLQGVKAVQEFHRDFFEKLDQGIAGMLRPWPKGDPLEIPGLICEIWIERPSGNRIKGAFMTVIPEGIIARVCEFSD